MLKNKEDPYLSLLSHRATTPLTWCGLTPAELFMGRKLRTSLPILKDFLKTDWKYLDYFRKNEADFKRKQKGNYDRRRRARPLVSILKDSPVWLDGDIPGAVTSTASTPRFYLVATPRVNCIGIEGTSIYNEKVHPVPFQNQCLTEVRETQLLES